MLLPDINVLIYAHREDSPEHSRYADWLRELVRAPSPFGMAEHVLVGFLRIVTNRRIFPQPTPVVTAAAFCDELLSQPNAVLVLPTIRQWPLVVRLCSEARIDGPLVSDAYLAALAIDHGCEVVSTDGDFARFRGLRWKHPLRG